MPDSKPTGPLILPALRNGITFAFGDYDTNGKPHWLIHDPGRNKFFIIGWIEYEILERWGMRVAEAIVEDVNTQTTLQIDIPDVENVLRFLQNNYLIQQSGYNIHKQGKEQQLFKKDNIIHWLISYYLFFRIPLWHPDKFLTSTRRIGNFIFSRYLSYIMMALGCVAIYQISIKWTEFTHTFSSVFSLQGLFFSMIAFVICKFCHELGHAYMCKQYGIPVPTLGVAFLVFWPVLYTDTTLSWSLTSEKRLRIALAGMWIETYVTIIAALLWCNTYNPTIQAICYVTITINWMGSVLINVSPFMRFDGYYVLSDLIKMPNLQPRAFALTRWQVRRWLFGWDEPQPEKFPKHMHYFLVAYSIFTWLYRLTIYVGIAVLVYHFVIKLVGIILFAVELFYFILGPFVSEIKTWIMLKEYFHPNIRLFTTITICFFILSYLLLPTNETVRMPATLSYFHQFLIAPVEGTLVTNPPKVGTKVKADQPIVVLDSSDLDYGLQRLRLEYQKKVNELRRAALETGYSNQKGILLSEIGKQQAEYKKLYSLHEDLILRVPFNGVIRDIDPDLTIGTVVLKYQWIGDVIEPNIIRIEAYVHQVDMYLIHEGLTGYFYPHNLSDPKIPVKVIMIDQLNTNELSCQYALNVKQDRKQNIVVATPCYNANELGGEIATYLNDDSAYVPADSIYRVILQPLKPMTLAQIQRGTVILATESRSYSSRLIYWLKKNWIEESGF
jgi:putative peptide zinc metalloprotease protein